jgi:hypothetical protein
VFPHEVHHGLHVARPAGDGHHGILNRHHDAELAEGSVSAIDAVTTTPELVAVALVPIALRVAAVGGLAQRGRFDPLRRDQALALPHPFLKVELAEARDVLRRHAEPEAAERDALRALFPGRVPDPERCEQARAEVVDQLRARRLLDDRRQHVGRRGVVEEVRARLVRHRQRQKGARQPSLRLERELLEVLVVVAGRHRQQVPHAHRLQVRAGLGRGVLREERQDLVVEAEPPFGHGHPDRGCGEALAQRVEHVGRVLRVRRPPAFGHHLAVAHEHEAVQRVDLGLGRFHEGEDSGGGDPLSLGAAARQRGSRLGAGTSRERPQRQGEQ